MNDPETVVLTSHQASQLMALHVMIREGDIDFRGHEESDCRAARESIADVAQECALQLGGMSLG